jgi:hypothetical protein
MPLRVPLLLLVLPALLADALAQQAAPWQQEVAYEMDYTLFADRHRFEGTQRLTYTNNSPDTLRQVFYHLYFNAFQPNSLMAEQNRHLPDPDARVVPRIFELGPEEVGFHRVLSLEQDGQTVSWRVYDTVLQVELARPIFPGDTSVFDMAFEGQVPLQTRRSGRDSPEGVRFSMAQWYPKMAAYDGLGWHPHPYLGREFYAPFGTFEVRLTLPASYVVGATGTLQNPEAVGHGYEAPPDAGVVTTGPARRADGSAPDSLTWHFRAEQVHDFAWAADPRYVHERQLVTDVPGRQEPVAIHLLYLPEVAEGWRPMGGWMRDLTRMFSERYGTYPYPQFTVAQGADGGMEYPMFTLITGRRPPGSLFSVTAHEFAHMWWYGTVATNETLFSWMDEGLTNFATTEAIHAILRGASGPADHSSAIEAVVRAQREGYYERPNKPADWYRTNRGFGTAAYSAGQAFVALLGYVMGDEARDRLLYRFGTEWRFRHPYPADFQKLAQDVSGMHLNWLFEQFLNGAEPYDYAATNLRAERTTSGYRSTVTLERRAPGGLPQDVLLRYADGSVEWVHVPFGEALGHKAVPANWRVAEPWPWVHPTYTLTAEGASPVVEVTIDPTARTPDLNRENNRVATRRR